MKTWEIKFFDDVFIDSTKYGKKIMKENYLPAGAYPIIDQGQNFIAGYTNDKTAIYSDVPAIIFGDHTRIIKYIETPFFLGADGVKLLKSKISNINYKYLYYYMLSANIPNTGYNRHYKWLKDLQVPLPPLDIQKQIADTLDKASRLIELRKQQLEKMDLLIKSKFIEMFGDPVTNPMGWNKCTIRDLVTTVNYGTSAPAMESGKYIYLRMNNITYEGHLDLSNLKYINISDKDLEKYLAKRGDILFNRTNSKELVGKTSVFKEDIPMVIAGYIIRIRTNEKAHPEYISAVLNSKYGKKTLFEMCKSIIGQANINAQELQDIKTLMPPISLQNKFADYVEKVEQQKICMQQSLDKMEMNYKALMQEYFG